MSIDKEKIEENESEVDKFINSVEKLSDYQQQHKYLFRICLLGDANVGKTSLLSRFCDNSFKENYNNTIGVDFRLVTLKCNGYISKIHIWDTAGQERFRSLALNYLNNSHGFIFMYDITDRDSFNNVVNWIDLALEKNVKTIANFLVGNKCDNEGKRQISIEEGKNLAKDKNLFFMETSAKANNNVQKLFYFFLYKLIEFYKTNNYVDEEKLVLNKENSEEISTIRPSKKNCNC
jgi:Ras-related protein Rab-1A